jgi:ABC-type branched-subunit amino acid transport system ATPase component/predicted MFS family arabinose efflux permease
VITKIRTRLEELTGGGTVVPILLLFVLNLVDEFDQVAFGVFAPEIRDTFGISDATFTRITTVPGALLIMLIVPVGVLADRYNRVKLIMVAAVAWGSMTILTGASGFIGGGVLALLILARLGSGLGRLMNEPVHASLLADYYEPSAHGRVYAFHRLANPIGAFLILVGGLLGQLFGWRLAFMLLSVPTFITVFFIGRLKEPVRGASVNMSLAKQAEAAGEKIPFWEGVRRLSAIKTFKRFWVAAFFLGGPVLAIVSFFSFFFEKVYGVESPGVWGRGGITALYSAGVFAGTVLWGRLSDKTIGQFKIPRMAQLGGLALGLTSIALVLTAVAPWLPLSIFFVVLVGVGSAGFLAFHLPVTALVAPPRLRSLGFALFGFWFGIGAIIMSGFVASIGENQGYRWGIAVLAIIVAFAGAIYASAYRFVERDMQQALNSLQTEANLRSELESSGEQALLVCRGIEVAYDQVQVLFGVDMEVRPGEIVALLGTNGAGKSTLLRAISGSLDPIGGAIFFDGRDITHTDAQATVKLGVVQVPGGKAVFPTLTVAEHLRAAGWLYRDDPEYLKQATEEVLVTFPRLRERIDQMAGNLSGGEQQMLALGMAFIAKPKLLMIDELSLGLAPTIVEQLLGIVRRIQQQGTAIILVEQSINVALTVAERAYFLEKGEVRFEGPTAELIERDDIVRSVFLTGAASPGTATVKRDAIERTPIGDTVLELDGLVKRFGGITAVDGTTFHLREHEILGLIGPNGAGKTTIFDLISGFLTPDEGRITFDGVDVTSLSPDKRAWLGLGRSFQDARLVPSLTVAENIAIGLERFITVRDPIASALGLPGVVRAEEDVAWTVADLIELMNLGAYRDKFVRELSTGTRRIVDLAMCIGHDPKVLLLDEPSSGIAQRETEALGPLLHRIQKEAGCALLIIEHDMPLITSISDRMIALELGRPIVEGTPEEVTTDPTVVSSYLGGDMATINRSGSAPAPAPATAVRARRTRRRTTAEAVAANGRASQEGNEA